MATVCPVHWFIDIGPNSFSAVLSPSFAIVLAVVLFFGADRAGASKICFWLQLRSVRLLVQKLIYSLKGRFLWCGKFHVVSGTLLKVSTVRLAFQKRFLVLSVHFLRRCLFQVVSLSSRFETTPDLNASKHIKFVVRKV